MRSLSLIILTVFLFGFQEQKELNEKSSAELKTMATKGIYIEFIFKSNKPTFGELFLITGSEDPKFPAQNRQFEKLNNLGFSFIDYAYYGIKNENKIGDGVTIWLFPMKNGNTEYDDYDAPFDSMLMEYTVLSNTEKSSYVVKKVFFAFKDNIDVKIVFEGKEVNDYKIIENRINDIIEVCRTELKVEPGSEEALRLVWGTMPLYKNGNN
ncbi:hypothetical protein [Psychroserpens ponticola]|uniref:GLPGLI family protein n=1 Tax=Psychroserpens ponticola TaxID=2932268 RepID=A0ABY7RXH3_9FLAO|nr:hypothetical protein [Psychroserpens ponticola]WCO01558.1 hypothetical protein MUN68_016015 [Psychroserpens ponticola]